MFSTTPIRRMFVFCAISAARAATSCASGCGVVTTMASARGSSWPSEIETSPVPGGMSTTSVSSAPQWTSERNCSSARCSIGPRHMTGEFSSRKKPIDISFSATPLAVSPSGRPGMTGRPSGSTGPEPPGWCRGSRRFTGGTIILSTTIGRWRIPSRCGIEWP
jgi:hypothetical protein